jgi:hypothetical protein
LAPSVSVFEAETDWVPSAAQLLTPEAFPFGSGGGGSLQTKLTATSVLFQPAAFGLGETEAWMVGATLSSLTTTEPLPLLPSWSVAVAVFVTPAVLPFWLSVAGLGPLATPDPEPSDALQVIVTLLLFQPAALGAGERLPVTVGPVLSSVYEALPAPLALLQALLVLKLG